MLNRPQLSELLLGDVVVWLRHIEGDQCEHIPCSFLTGLEYPVFLVRGKAVKDVSFELRFWS